MFHVEILVRFVFIPDEISYEPTHYKSVFAELLQKVAVFFEDLVGDSGSAHDQVLGVVLCGPPLEAWGLGSGLGLAIDGGEVRLLEEDGQAFLPVAVDGNVNDGGVVALAVLGAVVAAEDVEVIFVDPL